MKVIIVFARGECVGLGLEAMDSGIVGDEGDYSFDGVKTKSI